ncbi:hypothetical protein OSTOST_02718 [Ostertagia ostertagi]
MIEIGSKSKPPGIAKTVINVNISTSSSDSEDDAFYINKLLVAASLNRKCNRGLASTINSEDGENEEKQQMYSLLI